MNSTVYRGTPICRSSRRGALEFVTILQREFGARRKDLLGDRAARLERLNAGERPDFLPETRDIRMSEWNVATLPRDLLDRRVEITGPVDQKMIINALNSGARVFMADTFKNAGVHARLRSLATCPWISNRYA